MSDIPDDAPRPRLCQLTKWVDFDGYGFNLHAEKAKPGQYIGKVDNCSPAEAAGLKQGDRIIEVNGVNISNENHKQVVERIKSIPNETRLLVVDDDTDAYYRQRRIIVRGTQPNILVGKTPPTQSEYKNRHQNSIVHHGDQIDTDKNSLSNASQESVPSIERNGHEIERHSSSNNYNSDENDDSNSHKSSPAPTRTASPGSDLYLYSNTKAPYAEGAPPARPQTNGGPNGLNLNMTAQEMRAMLAQRKKKDVKKDGTDLKQKYAIIQNM